MKCNNCGNNLLPGANFCTKCGSKIMVEQPVTNTFFNQTDLNNEKVNNLLEENREHTFFDGGYNAPVYKRKVENKSGIAATIVGIVICIIIVGIAIFLAYRVLNKDNGKDSNIIKCSIKTDYVDSDVTMAFDDNGIYKVSGNLIVQNVEDTSDMSETELQSITYHSFLYLSLTGLDEDEGANVSHNETEKTSTIKYDIEKKKMKDTSYFEDYDGMSKKDIINEYEGNGYTCK